MIIRMEKCISNGGCGGGETDVEDIRKIDGEQYCMYCNYWKRIDGRMRCTNANAKGVWLANQFNVCDYFDGELQPKRDWNKAWKVGYRPSTFSKN